ncbi:LAME_0B01090g1_1 [Lachancea meyersii CBS 8951]|uniref:LAME_0B01090g1_1 n=1 Tax=Lachancea meyersii CBS 8951 TaxID=1266667 RepID=A0A1G4ISZ2_9SACH|nr:LAME_0B01090g1_1 [Lachancea meyersii CBS 8951]
MSKRGGSPNAENCVKRPESLTNSVANEYTKYHPSKKVDDVDVIELPSNPESIVTFLRDYVIARKPCKINGVISRELLLEGLTPTNITSTLPAQKVLQVERKVDGGFGSGEKKLRMTFEELMARLKKGESGLYLTTQYAGETDDGQDVDKSSAENFKNTEEEDDGEDEVKDDESSEEEDDEAGGPFDDDALSDAESFTVGDCRDDFDDLESLDEAAEIVVDLKSGPLDVTEAQERLKELYQPPMDNLINILPETPEFMNALIPQQINLWIGASAAQELNADDAFLSNYDPKAPRLGLGRSVPGGGSSSGLHHDHADNIYAPVSGRKRFTLFSPKDAAKMYTVGVVRKVYDSGVIDYARCQKSPSWRTLRDDGAILAEVAHQQLNNGENLSTHEKQKWQKIIDEDEASVNQESNAKLDPPSFSKVIPTVVHLDKIQDQSLQKKIRLRALEEWPLFFEANRLVVDLEPGQMLYLPTGWFHEVTSFGDSDTTIPDAQIHVAVNYWFIPPNGSSPDDLYPNEDKYWHNDFERTKAALENERQETEVTKDDANL